MKKVLLHCCCAPCSVSCIEPLLNEGFEVTLFWYNPNIHPFKEYESRRDCFIEYAESLGLTYIVKEDYGLREFVKNVADDIDNRCSYCYSHRLLKTAEFAKAENFDCFTSTLFASLYQNHELMKKKSETYEEVIGVEFLYRDFRPNFREGNQKAREMGFYMQKYCGCIFSEEERYQKQIKRDREKFSK